MTGVWDLGRPTEGALSAFLEFADGAAATLVYNGYDHFDTDELHFWVGEGGQQKTPRHGQTRRSLGTQLDPDAEVALKYSTGYGGAHPVSRARVARPTHQPHFGLLIASCERGDLRPSADGVLIYDDAGQREVVISGGLSGVPGRGETLAELHAAVFEGRAVFHSGRWAKATLATCLAIQQSAHERREVFVEHQVTTADGVLK
jgi:phthalate 4,5-cis-dihydrodiol dehydrogenase